MDRDQADQFIERLQGLEDSTNRLTDELVRPVARHEALEIARRTAHEMSLRRRMAWWLVTFTATVAIVVSAIVTDQHLHNAHLGEIERTLAERGMEADTSSLLPLQPAPEQEEFPSGPSMLLVGVVVMIVSFGGYLRASRRLIETLADRADEEEEAAVPQPRMGPWGSAPRERRKDWPPPSPPPA